MFSQIVTVKSGFVLKKIMISYDKLNYTVKTDLILRKIFNESMEYWTLVI